MAKAKQEALPGAGVSKIPSLTRAARALANVRDEKRSLKDREEELAERLLTLMMKHKIERYGPVDGVVVTVSHGKDSVKVARATEGV